MKLTLVVVLYKMKIEDSKTIMTLLSSSFSDPYFNKDLHWVIYDNSPEEQSLDENRFRNVNIKYVHDKRNLGIATAYNYALNFAEEQGSDWLLLLDHDTTITGEYAHTILNNSYNSKELGAIVPQIDCNGIKISPVYSNTLRPLQEERPLPGVTKEPIMAINSGALVSVRFLNGIGGFNNDFPLDYLDHWLFYEIHSKKQKIEVLDVTLTHELSVMDYNQVSINRYKSILDSEMKFYSNYKKELLNSYKMQLIKRTVKQLLTVKNKGIPFYTLKKFLLLNMKS